MKAGMAISLVFWALILSAFLLSGCSLSVEVGYHGKTGRDDTKITESFRKRGQ